MPAFDLMVFIHACFRPVKPASPCVEVKNPLNSDFTGRDFSGKCINLVTLGIDINIKDFGLFYPGIASHYNFTDANLSSADFAPLRCTGADFTRADLRGTNFTRVMMNGATLTDAKVAHNYSAEQWEADGLMPRLSDGRVLVWKHVTKELIGNLGYPYVLGEEFMCACMTTAGPMGAIKDWSYSDDSPHILAVAADALYDFDPEKGIYYALRGTPLALYRAENIDKDGCDLVRVAGTPGDGIDPLTLIDN